MGSVGRPAYGPDHYLKIDARSATEKEIERAIFWLNHNGYQRAAQDKRDALNERKRETTLNDEARSLRPVPDPPIRLSGRDEPQPARPSQGRHYREDDAADAREYLDGKTKQGDKLPMLQMLGLDWFDVARPGSIPTNTVRFNSDGLSFSKLFAPKLAPFLKVGSARYLGAPALALRFYEEESPGSVRLSNTRPAYLSVNLVRTLKAHGFTPGPYTLVECADGWLAVKA